MDYDFLELPIVGDVKESDIPTPEEYQYWVDRKNRTFYIDFEIEMNYALIELSKTIIQLNMEDKDKPVEELKPITIFIQSYGGDLSQAFFFCDLIKSSRIPIITVGMGVVMSAGFLIFLAGHKRYCFAHSQFLCHEGSAGFQGTADQIAEAQKNYKKQLDQMKEYILKNTEIPEKVFNRNKSKDWYLTPDELIEYKGLDEIITDISNIL